MAARKGKGGAESPPTAVELPPAAADGDPLKDAAAVAARALPRSKAGRKSAAERLRIDKEQREADREEAAENADDLYELFVATIGVLPGAAPAELAAGLLYEGEARLLSKHGARVLQRRFGDTLLDYADEGVCVGVIIGIILRGIRSWTAAPEKSAEATIVEGTVPDAGGLGDTGGARRNL